MEARFARPQAISDMLPSPGMLEFVISISHSSDEKRAWRRVKLHTQKIVATMRKREQGMGLNPREYEQPVVIGASLDRGPT